MSKVALVTGAGRGLGAATAERLAQDGWDVVVHYHETAEGAEHVATMVRAFGQRALIVKADVSRHDEVQAIVEETMREMGRLDAVVNNAGIYKRSTIDATDPADWHEALDVNLTGSWYVLRAALPHLGEGARIVNFSSVMARLGSKHGAHYAASKAGLEAMTRSLAKELAPKKILVNCVAPGAFETAMIGDDSKETRRWRLRDIPLGRVGDPSEIAGVVSFLLGPDAGYITGQVIHVDGGLSM